jgi:hypothetical protein
MTHVTVYFLGGPWHGSQRMYPERPHSSYVEIKALDTLKLVQSMSDVDLERDIFLEEELPMKTGLYERLPAKAYNDDGTVNEHYNVLAKSVWLSDREKNTLTLFWAGWQ